MTSDSQVFLDRWHKIVATRDLVSLPEVLATDVALGAPPYWDKLQGRDLVAHLLGIIVNTIEAFTYHREWVMGAELALEFTGRVKGTELQGIDLITLDAQGHVSNLDVLMRPLNAVIELREVVAPQMARYLSARSARGA